jgi:hypothetical protein
MPKKFKEVDTDSMPADVSITTAAAALAKLNEDIPEAQRARPASEDTRGTFEVAASESGIDKKGEQREATNTLRNRLLVMLEKARNGTLSYIRILEESGASRNALKKLLQREKKKEFPRFRKSGQYSIKLCSGLSRHVDINWATAEIPPKANPVLLPEQLRGIIGPKDGIYENMFFMVGAGPDSYKTGLLLDIAKAAAMEGRKVLYLNHETDLSRMARLLAQRESRRLVEANNALQICRDTKWIQNIQIRTTAEVQIEELDLEGYDMLCWDYLSASFLRADTLASQGSNYSKFVQLIGQHVVDKGIPVAAAVQKHWGEGGIKSTWFERSTVTLVVDDIQRNAAEGKDYVVYEIVKNKEQGYHDYIDAEFDNTLGTLLRADPLSKKDYALRKMEAAAEAKKEARERAEEDEEIAARKKKAAADQRWKDGKETRGDKWKATRAANKAKEIDDDSLDWEEETLDA